MSVITCCRYCVAPKRYPGCHDSCPEYLKEKAEYQERKAIEDMNTLVGAGIQQQKNQAIRKAMRSWKTKSRW